jgi:hypothetical protein
MAPAPTVKLRLAFNGEEYYAEVSTLSQVLDALSFTSPGTAKTVRLVTPETSDLNELNPAFYAFIEERVSTIPEGATVVPVVVLPLPPEHTLPLALVATLGVRRQDVEVV